MRKEYPDFGQNVIYILEQYVEIEDNDKELDGHFCNAAHRLWTNHRWSSEVSQNFDPQEGTSQGNNKEGKEFVTHMQIKVEVFEIPMHHPDVGRYHSYGIRAHVIGSDDPNDWETVYYLSSDRRRVEEFADWFGQGQIHPRHLQSMLEDEF